MEVTELVILGVPIGVLTAGAVQELKSMGLPTKFAGVASWITAGMLTASYSGMQGELSTQQAYFYVLAGLVYGLGSQGVYDTIRMLKNN